MGTKIYEPRAGNCRIALNFHKALQKRGDCWLISVITTLMFSDLSLKQEMEEWLTRVYDLYGRGKMRHCPTLPTNFSWKDVKQFYVNEDGHPRYSNSKKISMLRAFEEGFQTLDFLVSLLVFNGYRIHNLGGGGIIRGHPSLDLIRATELCRAADDTIADWDPDFGGPDGRDSKSLFAAANKESAAMFASPGGGGDSSSKSLDSFADRHVDVVGPAHDRPRFTFLGRETDPAFAAAKKKSAAMFASHAAPADIYEVTLYLMDLYDFEDDPTATLLDAMSVAFAYNTFSPALVSSLCLVKYSVLPAMWPIHIPNDVSESVQVALCRSVETPVRNASLAVVDILAF